MSRSRVIAFVTAVTAVTAVFYVGAAGASAAEWFVDGSALGSGSKAALATSAAVDSSFSLSAPAEKVKVRCSGSTLNGVGPEIIGKNLAKAEHLVFTGCSTTEPSTGCELKGQPTNIETRAVEATLTLANSKAPADRVTFKPQHGSKVFARVPFEGTGKKVVCQEEQSVSGAVTLNAPTGEDEGEVQAIEGLGSIENNSLELGAAGIKSYIEGGKALLKLASEASWSFGPGGLDKADEGKENFEDNEAQEENLTFEILGLPFINVVVSEPKIMYLTAPGGFTEAFKIIKDTCEGLLKAGELCHIELTFTPKGAGRYLSDLLLVVKEDGGIREELQRVMLIFNVP